MIESVFLSLLNQSIAASWMVLAAVVFRLLLKKAPKSAAVVLWALVGLRLVCPFSLESVFSLIPSAETVPEEILYTETPVIHSGISFLNSAVNPVLSETFAPETGASVNPMQFVAFAASAVWLTGMAVMAGYLLFSTFRIRRKVREAVPFAGNVWLCDRISSPFIFGVIRPRIYLPSDMAQHDISYVTAHEKTHIQRRDYLWKPLGFLLLCVYWFNPVLWVAYVLLCRDIELACDEKVIASIGAENRKQYADVLVRCSAPRRMIAACPLAFGEVGVKQRIRSVLHYKKPSFWILILAALTCVALAVGFLTNPKTGKTEKTFGLSGVSASAECDNVEFEFLHGSLNPENRYISVRWTNKTDQVLCFGEEFILYKNGEEYPPEKELIFNALMHIVNPGGNQTEIYSLPFWNFDKGSYRLEKTFYLENEPDRIYKASLEFRVDDTYSFSGKQYGGIDILYENQSYSSILYDGQHMPFFSVSSADFHLQVKDYQTTGSDFVDVGRLQKIELTKKNFDRMFDEIGWKENFSAKNLRKNNQNAFSVSDAAGNLYYLLQQKNGEILVAQGYTGPMDPAQGNEVFRSSLRWVFRLVPAEIVSPQNDSGDLSADPETLQRRYPQYFGLPADEGLTVYVWMLGEHGYFCGLLPGQNREVNSEVLWSLKGVSLAAMRKIVASYHLPKAAVSVRLIGQPYSSYWYEISDRETERVEALFWSGYDETFN